MTETVTRENPGTAADYGRGELTFTTSHRALAHALADLKPFVNTRLAKRMGDASAGLVLFERIDHETVRASVYDWEVAASTTITTSGAPRPDGTSEHIGDGRALVPHAELAAFLTTTGKGLTKGQAETRRVTVDVCYDMANVSTSAGSAARLDPGDISAYPRLPEPASAQWIGERKATRAQLDRTLLAVGTDETLPMLAVARLRADVGNLVATGTDRFRLTETRTPGLGSVGEFDPVLVPGTVLTKVLKRGTGDTFSIGLTRHTGADWATFRDAARTISVRLYDGEFPRTHMLWPRELDATATVDRDALVALIEPARKISRKKDDVGYYQQGAVRLSWDAATPGIMQVAVCEVEHSSVGLTWQTLPATVTGTAIPMQLTVERAIDALNTFPAGEVVLVRRGDSSHKPLRVTESDAPDDDTAARRTLVMPYGLPS